MAEMTLRELCETSGVSRRAIQGYEHHELVKASGKNKYGYLVYDEMAQERIKKIKLFQRMGFSLQEIKTLIDAGDDVIVPALERQVDVLGLEIIEKQEILAVAKGLIEDFQNGKKIS